MNEQPITAMGALRSLATTQTQVDVFSDQIIEAVKEGSIDPLEVLIQVRAFEKAAERILKEIRENILTAADKHGGRPFELYGNRLEKSEAGTKYNYAATGDPVWSQRDAIVRSATELLKEREAFLRALKEPTTIVDEGSGEVVKLMPPPKTSTAIVKVTIK